ncbi:MAG: hypothetical protein M3Y33_18115, partial [Actinomycetota bacterium]|nr:hypothetical protein [Actinomycetota bacterium]
MRRSQIAFIRGAWMAVRKVVVPVARMTASKDRVKFDPRWRGGRRHPRRGPGDHGNDLRVVRGADREEAQQ